MLANLALAFVSTVVAFNIAVTLSPMVRLVLDGPPAKVPVEH